MVQLAESVKQVKAWRNDASHNRQMPVYFQTLKTRFKNRVARTHTSPGTKFDTLSQLERDDIIFAGREFLISFDPSIQIPDIWVSGFELACINHLREDLEFRQR